jgi:hypothetical protein
MQFWDHKYLTNLIARLQTQNAKFANRESGWFRERFSTDRSRSINLLKATSSSAAHKQTRNVVINW